MDQTDQRRLDAILAASPHLTALAGHVRALATMMCSRRGQELDAWMTAVGADNADQPALRSFVRGLRRDQDAVTAGLASYSPAEPDEPVFTRRRHSSASDAPTGGMRADATQKLTRLLNKRLVHAHHPGRTTTSEKASRAGFRWRGCVARTMPGR